MALYILVQKEARRSQGAQAGPTIQPGPLIQCENSRSLLRAVAAEHKEHGTLITPRRRAGLGRTRLIHPWVREAEGGSDSEVSVSHVERCGPKLSWTQVSHL